MPGRGPATTTTRRARAWEITARWLQELGLALKPSKTRLGHTLHPVGGIAGFDFLGFHIRQYPVGQTKTGKTGQGIPLGFKTRIKPAPAGQRRHLRQLHEEVRKLPEVRTHILTEHSS